MFNVSNMSNVLKNIKCKLNPTMYGSIFTTLLVIVIICVLSDSLLALFGFLCSVVYWVAIYPVVCVGGFAYFLFSNVLLPLAYLIVHFVSTVCFLIVALLVPLAILVHVAIKSVPEEGSFNQWLEQLIRMGVHMSGEGRMGPLGASGSSNVSTVSATTSDTSNTSSNTDATTQNQETSFYKTLSSFKQKMINWGKVKFMSTLVNNNLNTVFTYWGVCRIAYCIERDENKKYVFVGIFNTWIPIS